ncbi:MAG: glucose-6-phosphate isomerase [bacterium]
MASTQYLTNLAPFQDRLDAALAQLASGKIIERIWQHSHSVWSPDPTEIANRLGWLHSPEAMPEHCHEIQEFVEQVKAAGYCRALLLGMGGSSLAPEVFRFTFGVQDGFLDLAVLDSTDPGAVLAQAEALDPDSTLFLVSTKSGGTIETLSFFKYFYTLTAEAVGHERAGAHFVAITDPGSALEKMAAELDFRKCFLNDPNIGGRFSVLSYFGLVPAALIGLEVQTLLERAREMARLCRQPDLEQNEGALLGAVLGELALAGRDKMTMVASPQVRFFGAWVEQLIAESTGKAGKGILPVDLEEPGAPQVYGDDRLFVYWHLHEDATYDPQVSALRAAGFPVVQIELRDLYDLGREFFRWEMATAVACERLGVNPFDQPNVESAKTLARKMVSEYQEKGELPTQTPNLATGDLEVYTDFEADDLAGALATFFAPVSTGREGPVRAYVAIQAYVQPAPETDKALQALRHTIRDRLQLAVTVGYGPRFLHSTGQLHKGDSGNGLFIQITAEVADDAPIPDHPGKPESSMTFGVLETAQALGDGRALLAAGRKVMRLHLKGKVADGLKLIAESIG